MRVRMKRVTHPHAWSQAPEWGTNHVVSNVMIESEDTRKGEVVELRYFGGLSVKETAEVLNVSAITVMRDWNMAKAWLAREIKNA